MPTPVITDALRAQVTWTGAPGQKSWSTHFDYECTSGTFSLAAFSTAFRTELEAAFAALSAGQKQVWTSSCDISEYKFTAFQDPPSVITLAPTTPDWGTFATGAPPNLAAVATLRTAFAGASYRGRCYFGGLSAASYDATTGLLTATTQSAIDDLVTPLMGITDGGGAAYALGVVSTVSGGAPRTPPIITVVDSVSVNSRVDTQRRRIS